MKRLEMPKIKFYEPFLWVYFAWYYFPIIRVFFMSSTYNLIFFGILLGGCLFLGVEMLAKAKKLSVRFSPLVPVLLYFAFFAFLCVCEIGTANRHIRVSFSFWGTLVIFYLTGNYPDVRKRLAKLMLAMFVVTTVTSIFGVLLNPNAARILTFASNDLEEDIQIRLLNIGGLALFQGLVILVPIFQSFYCNNRHRTLSLIFIILVFVGILGASFSISLIMFFVALLLGQIANGSSKKNILIMSAITVCVFLIPWEEFLYFLAEHIENEKYQMRFISLANSLGSGSAQGNLESRLDVYAASLNTFLSNPLGVGPEYTYINYQNGIGYHSQILDDLARYGILAIAFYASFFVGYYRLLRAQWEKINLKQIAWPVTLVYFLFLVLNLGFTSEHESVLLLFLVPVMPELMEKGGKQKELLGNG